MCINTNAVLACLLWMVISIFDHALTHPQEKPLNLTQFVGPNPLRITVSERAAVNNIVSNSTNRLTAEDSDLVDTQLTFELIVPRGRILGAHYFDMKRFDSKSMDVVIRNSLMEGYRTINTYQLRVVAYDALKRMNNAYKDVILTILRNEGVPEWTHFLDKVYMREDTSPDITIVAQVNAADNKDNDTVTYYIREENAIRANVSSKSHYFVIQKERGLIKLKKSVFGTDIDFFEVTIKACDDGIPQRCVQRLMTVNVSKHHLPPQFSTSKYVFIMRETEGAGFSIGNITTTDIQPLGPTVYELIGAPGFFEVNRESGQLILKKSLRKDYDLLYKFRVRAYDTGEPLYISTANVTVKALRNINGPIFDSAVYIKNVRETFSVGETLLDANATDADKDPLVFSLSVKLEDMGYFYIDPTTGVIKLAKPLVNPPKPKFEFFVQVRDQRCVNERNATAKVIIIVQVDSAPSFVSSTDIPPLKDTAKRGDVVHTVLANDTDLDGSMTYNLVGQSPAPYMFSVDPTTGIITLSRDIIGSGLTLKTYTLEIEAYDSLYPNKKATQTLTVNVTMSAATPGCQAKHNYQHYQANEYVPPGSLIGTMFAKGSDGVISVYSLVGNPNGTAYVYTDPTTGKVKHTKSLVNPPKTKLTIIMTAHMIKEHYLPPFDVGPFAFFMSEKEGAGYNIGNIAFNSSSGALWYELIHPPKFFEVNKTSGQLSLSESLRNDFNSVYDFGVRAYEANKPKRIYVAKANVTVRVIRNANIPMFRSTVYQKTVLETFSVGQMLIDTKATDADGDTLVYSLVGNSNDTAFFYIDPSTGAINLAKSLVDPPKPIFQFSVEAHDQRCVNEGKGTANVVINVQVNRAPSFVSLTDIPPLKDTAKLGDVVHTLLANDNDLRGNMTYELIGKPPAPYMFSVNSSTGVITLARDINGSGLDGFDNYILEVVAYDSSFPNKKATQTLSVNVTMSPAAPKHKPDASYRFQGNDATLNNLHEHLLTIKQLLKPYVTDKHAPK